MTKHNQNNEISGNVETGDGSNLNKASIKKLSIKGFRGFEKKTDIEFALPNGIPGSGLTIIVGPNNSGKSTLLEALVAVTQEQAPTFSEGKRNVRSGSHIAIELESSDNQIRTVKTVSAGGSQTKQEKVNNAQPDIKIYVLSSRRAFPPYFNRDRELDRTEYTRLFQNFPDQRSVSLNFHSRLLHIIEDEERKTKFDDVFRKVIDPVPIWTIDQSDQGQYYVKFQTENSHHSSEGLGEGLISLLYIIDALYDSEPAMVIAIDEPELSLHPAIQRRLMRLIIEYSKDRQIILSTHSPLFIDWNAIAKGANIIRFAKENGQCNVHHLQKCSSKKLAGILDNRNNPHILGLNANEVFFLDDQVILVEGQEDVLLYPKIWNQLDMEVKGNLFGWGVGGADNMNFVASLLRDLGFQKVCGILDNDKRENIEHLNCEFPNFKFFAIPADDIRTKPAQKSKQEVTGLLDKENKIDEKFKKETRSIFGTVNAYMNMGN